MDAADYSEWLDFSGFYLENFSHADRYRAYEKKISPEGLNVRIVYDFLGDNDPRIDVASWRNYRVYEIDGGLPYRMVRTAWALAAIGAERTADAVRTSQNTTMLGQLTSGFFSRGAEASSELGDVDVGQLMQEFRRSVAAAFGHPAAGEPTDEPSASATADAAGESREEIAELLESYAAEYAGALLADVERYGDVRKEPGFDPDERRRELDQILLRRQDRENQIETLGKTRPLMEQMEAGVAKHGDQAARKLRSVRRKLLQGRRQFAGREPLDLLPEMRAWLEEFDAFASRYASVFYPPPVQNQSLLARLRNLGDYEYDVQEFGAGLSWNAPRGFDCDWPRVSLSILYPDGNEEALAEALDAVEKLQADFPSIAERLRAEALAGFRDFVLGMEGLDRICEWTEVSRDENGEVSEDEILRMAGDATLNVESMHQYGEGVTVAAWFPAEWDEEHGLEIPLVSGFGADEDEEGDDAF